MTAPLAPEMKVTRWYGTHEQIAYEGARAEHALLLRCEGLTLAEIGSCLGVCRERARQLVMRGARRLNWSMKRRHTKIWLHQEARA